MIRCSLTFWQWKGEIEMASGKASTLATVVTPASTANEAPAATPPVTEAAKEEKAEVKEKEAEKKVEETPAAVPAPAPLSELDLVEVTTDSSSDVADFDFQAKPRVAHNSMSASESRYFKKFGLQPPAQGRTESLHRIDSTPGLTPVDPRAPAEAEPVAFSSMRTLPRPSSMRVEVQVDATKSVQAYGKIRPAPAAQRPASALDAMAGSGKYTASGNAPQAREETPLLAQQQPAGGRRPLTEEEKRARQREMERRRRAQQQRDDGCCVIA